MKFSLDKARTVERDGFTAWLYNSKEQFPAVSSVYVDVRGAHERVYVKKSIRLYFVIKGRGQFTVGNETLEVKTNDVIIIPPKVSYSYKGRMRLFETNFPATGSEDEVKTETSK